MKGMGGLNNWMITQSINNKLKLEIFSGLREDKIQMSDSSCGQNNVF